MPPKRAPNLLYGVTRIVGTKLGRNKKHHKNIEDKVLKQR
jgi:hypothetical protein